MDWLELKKSGKSVFIHGDCMEYMKTMPEKFAELAIVDPPYGIKADQVQNKISKSGRISNGGGWKLYKETSWDDNPPDKNYFERLYFISKNQIIWGCNYFENIKPSSCWIIWDKIQRDNRSDAEMAWTSFKKPLKVFRYSRIDSYVNDCDIKIHPTQKPVALYRWILHNYAKPGDLIIDTHVGSASSLIACEQMGFQYIGFEIDKDYYDAAEKRINQARKKLNQNEIFKREEIEVKQESLF